MKLLTNLLVSRSLVDFRCIGCRSKVNFIPSSGQQQNGKIFGLCKITAALILAIFTTAAFDDAITKTIQVLLIQLT